MKVKLLKKIRKRFEIRKMRKVKHGYTFYDRNTGRVYNSVYTLSWMIVDMTSLLGYDKLIRSSRNKYEFNNFDSGFPRGESKKYPRVFSTGPYD